MFPPLSACAATFPLCTESVSRKARGPRRARALRLPPRERRGGTAVGQDGEQLPATEAIGLEREVTAVRRPRGTLIVAAAGEPARVRAVGVDHPDVVRAGALRVRDEIAARRPA